jgi:hypothetical protein
LPVRAGKLDARMLQHTKDVKTNFVGDPRRGGLSECVSATIERLAQRRELLIIKVAGSTPYDVEDLDLYIAINAMPEAQADALKT